MGLINYGASSQIRSCCSVMLRATPTFPPAGGYDIVLPTERPLAVLDYNRIVHGYHDQRNGLNFRIKPQSLKTDSGLVPVEFYVVTIDQKEELGGALNNDGGNSLVFRGGELQQRISGAHTRLIGELGMLGICAKEGDIYEELYSEIISS